MIVYALFSEYRGFDYTDTEFEGAYFTLDGAKFKADRLERADFKDKEWTSWVKSSMSGHWVRTQVGQGTNVLQYIVESEVED
jgi:hypothetical protein